jgi:antitoxin component HigA of HigAB toxin-antitoxin module
MTTTPTTPIQTRPTLPELVAALIVALAEVRQVTVSELEAERAGGDLEMASPEAVAVIATLQGRFGRRLAQVQDLEPEQLTSVANLADLLHRRWPTATPLPAEDGS